MHNRIRSACRARALTRATAIVAALLVTFAIGSPVARAAGPCGCMDVALVIDDTGSMGPAINNVKLGLADIVASAQTASGGDLRMGLVTFKDTIEVDQGFTATIPAVEGAIMSLAASGGAGEAEASDEALNLTVTGGSACTAAGILGSYRDECLKIAVLVTDAPPGGCDDLYTPGVDDVNAAAVAAAAAAAGVKVSAIQVVDGSSVGIETPIMMAYAGSTGGVFLPVPFDGTGTGDGIAAIIEGCGTPEICTDGVDNDGDGAIDCDDTDCTDVPACSNRPPDCGAAAPSVAELWPPNHKLVEVPVAGVTDPDGDPVSITITGVTQDEPLNGVGDGNTCPDARGVGTASAYLRAERAGSPRVPGNGRVYQVGFTASDGKGGECAGSVAVCVPHDQRRGHVCVDDGPLYDSTGPCS